MSDAKLSVEVTAKLDEVSKGLRSVIKEVEGFDKQTASSLKHVETRFNNLNGKLTGKTSAALGEVSKALATTAASAKTSGSQFIGLSRVMQDFAFGPAAIANNLEGLGRDLSELNRISKETGQSIGKTLIQSLVGGGGLNLALGALTMGMSVASFGMGAWTRMFPKANEKIKNFVDTLNALEQVQLKGAQSGQQEITHLEVLFRAVTDANRPLEDRKKIYKELHDQYPKYFKNIALEKTSNEGLTTAYTNLKTAILEAAYARAAEEKIGQNASRQTENSEKILQERIENQKLLAQLPGLEKIQAAEYEAGINSITTSRKIYNLKEQIAASDKRIFDLASDSKILNEQNLRLLEKTSKLSVDAITNKPGGSVSDLGGTDKTFGELLGLKQLDKLKAIGDLKANGINGINGAIIPGIKQTTEQLQALTATVQGMPDAIERPLSDVGIAFQATIGQLNEDFLRLNESLAMGITDSISNMMGAFLTGGDALGAFGQSFLQSFAQFLGGFGDQLIKFGIAAEAFNKLRAAIANPFSGALSAGAAIAVIAAGVALKGMASAISSSIGGGSRGGDGGGMSAMSINRGYSTSPRNSYPSGNSLASLSSARQQPTFVISNKIEMGQLVTEVEREQRRRDRVR